jgi:hypothetical protein
VNSNSVPFSLLPCRAISSLEVDADGEKERQSRRIHRRLTSTRTEIDSIGVRPKFGLVKVPQGVKMYEGEGAKGSRPFRYLDSLSRLFFSP